MNECSIRKLEWQKYTTCDKVEEKEMNENDDECENQDRIENMNELTIYE